MSNGKIASELLKIASDIIADAKEAGNEIPQKSLLHKVLSKYGEKTAKALHSEVLRQSQKYTGDTRINPDEEFWTPDMVPIMIDSAISELKKLRKIHK